jgi:hypothetical protein
MKDKVSKKKSYDWKSYGKTVAFRIPEDLLKFYEDRASAERRKLSAALRIALEDHAAALQSQDKAA